MKIEIKVTGKSWGLSQLHIANYLIREAVKNLPEVSSVSRIGSTADEEQTIVIESK